MASSVYVAAVKRPGRRTTCVVLRPPAISCERSLSSPSRIGNFPNVLRGKVRFFKQATQKTTHFGGPGKAARGRGGPHGGVAVRRPAAPKVREKPETSVFRSVPKAVHLPDGTSRPRTRPTATNSGSRVLPNGRGQRAGARVATRAATRRPKDHRRGHQNGSIRLAARHAAHPENRDWAVGSAIGYRRWHRQSDVHGRWANDGSPARLSEEVPADAPGRPEDGTTKTCPVAIGVNHEKDPHWQQAG